MTTHHRKSSLDAVRTVIRDDPHAFIDGFYMRLFTAHPDLRDLFPASLVRQRAEFARALDSTLAAFAESADPTEMVDYLAQLGRDHRKYGVADIHLVWATEALAAEAAARIGERYDGEYLDEVVTDLTVMTQVMRGGLSETTEPAWWTARVVDKRIVARDIAVVRLVTDAPLAYRSGQSLDVSIPQWPRSWRIFSPAVPPNANGELEFYIRALDDGLVSRSVVVDTRVGDVWKLARAHGDMVMYEDSSTVMIAGGCGLAPLRAMVMDLAARGAHPPNTTLFYAATSPGELFDLSHLRALAAGRDWLTIVAVTETREDPWWADPLPTPDQLGIEWLDGVAVDAVLEWEDRHGYWVDRRYLVSGPPQMIDATRRALTRAGVSDHRISSDALPSSATVGRGSVTAARARPAVRPVVQPASSIDAPGMASISARVYSEVGFS